MSALGRLAVGLASEIVAVRKASDDVSTTDVVAAAMLGFVSEPGDGVMGGLVSVLGVGRVADAVRSDVTVGDLHAEATEAGSTLEAREIDAGLGRWRPRLDDAAFGRAFAQAARIGARLVVPGDDDWPDGMRGLDAHAPLALWVRGRVGALAQGRSIALVGARAATNYGVHVTAESAAGLVDRGITIVSGGAYGIDGTAHRAALASGGDTIAFLAGGVDRFYPAGHESLLTRVAETGAVASELACGAAPTRWRFLQRNRLIAAASDATVVLEAGMRSGSLNTAGHASALGRPLGAVPGPVTSPASAGCHRLLREYDAVCVTDAAQMAELVPERTVANAGGGLVDDGAVLGRGSGLLDALSGDEGRVFDALGPQRARTVGELVERSGTTVPVVLGALGALEAVGLAAARADGWVRRRPS